jgi:hypothetical protein
LSLAIRNMVRVIGVLAITALIVLSILPRDRSRAAGAGQSADPSDVKKTPVYVNDFELSSLGAIRAQSKATTNPGQKKNGEPVFEDTDPPPLQARRIVDAFGDALVEQLQKSGYTAATRVSGNPPSTGVLLRGVFAETDDKNRIRRAVLGAGSPNANFLLYVASFNLAHQDQPLYQAAVVQFPDPHYGPVITLNAYVPMMKYEIDKSPVEEDVRKICAEIESNLTKLLATNPYALPK